MTLPMLLRNIPLSAEQDVRIRQILGKGRGTTQSLADQLRNAEEKLADQLVSPAPLRAADVQPQLDRISALRHQMLEDAARVSLDIRAVLTHEQLAKAQHVRDRIRLLQAEMRQLTQPAIP